MKEDNEDTFGPWMMAKRTTLNKVDNKKTSKGERERKFIPTNTQMLGSLNQNKTLKSGSRFAMLWLEAEGAEESVVETPWVDPREEVTKPSTNILEKKEESRIKDNKVQQVHTNLNPIIQHKVLISGKQDADTNMLKSKSIMERFIKSKGRGENRSMGSLKASASGAFKNQKLKKPLNQWDKTKCLVIVDEMCKSNVPPNPLSRD